MFRGRLLTSFFYWGTLKGGGGAQNYVGILGKNTIDPIVDGGYIEECS